MNSELRHHKYIYKKKVNGKWRYYYDIGEASYIDGYTGKKPSRIRGYSKFDDLLGKDERDRASRASSAYEFARSNAINREYKSRKEMEAANKKVAQLGRNAIESNRAYLKTPLGRIDQAKGVYKKAKSTVARLLRRLANKID